ncbi:MAG TPA: LptE family protein [Chitinophagaceae bacterium]|nr:LptE family protein [Chitinophagaceae bacterium]HNF70866.1 LptE family protein [Chitinophagaceae bacterium]
MILKIKFLYFGLLLLLTGGCGVYSFTGAAIDGKTINVHFIENQARNISPSLSPTFTEKLRQRILSQTPLSQVNSDQADYDISGHITSYEVSIASVSGNETTSKNRLTISVQIHFVNRKNEKAAFDQSFSRFQDFSADQNFQNVESKLIADICDQLADDIFNKAFVNW